MREEAGQWRIQGELAGITESVPDTLRHIIERQVDRLPVTVQHLLEVATVAGVEFAAATVAAGLQAPVEEIDQQCETLARQEQFIQARGAEEWPDGTLSERYGFRHGLYHAVLYDRLTETQRVRLHRRIGERKEAAYGERVGEIATELSAHFEKGRETGKAVRYLQRPGENAMQRYAKRKNRQRANKHKLLSQTTLKKAQKVLGTKTETETIERALKQGIDEAEQNRQAWAAHERFLRGAVRGGLVIADVYGRLEGE